jgi:CheY-specific phosphatase CheX
VTEITIRAALASAVGEVLESMFFLDTVGEAAEPAAEQDAVTVHLTFEGDPPGGFEMRLARAAANAIAADFLGEDAESLTQQQSTDVTLELANMICGAVLSRIESSASFRLGTPHVVADIAARDTREQLPEEATRYTVETGSGTLTAAIRMGNTDILATEKYAS